MEASLENAVAWLDSIYAGEGTSDSMDSIFDALSAKWKTYSLEQLQALEPTALWVPGMQTDGFRVDGDTTYLTQLTDLSGNGHDAVQTTATRQASLDGSDAVFSGGQGYDTSTTLTILQPLTCCCRCYPKNTTSDLWGTIFDSATSIDTYRNLLTFKSGSTREMVIYAGSELPTSGYVIKESNIIVLFNTSNSYIVQDGEILNTGNPGTSTLKGGIRIGDDYNGHYFLIGTISTLALYNKTLTTTEQTIVNQCLTILGE